MMRRIVHIISTPLGVGGAERVMAALLEGGAGRGWEQWVLNPFARPGQAELLGPLCAGSHYEGRACERLSELPSLRRWLDRRLREVRPDVVHTHLVHALIATATLRRRAPCLLATHHHGRHLDFTGRRALRVADRWAGRRYDRVVAVSESVQRYLEDGYGYRPAHVSLIPNGWAGLPRAETGLAEHPTVACVANFRAEKGHRVLLDAFAEVRQAVPGARLVLAGQGELEDTLRARCAELDMSADVEFRGALEDVWPLLAEAHVFALASFIEPLGIAVLEAMAAGLPVVASAVDGINEVVRPDETGVLVPPGDVCSLALELTALLRDPARRERMGAAGRAAAAERPLARTVDGYFDLYEHLLIARRAA